MENSSTTKSNAEKPLSRKKFENTWKKLGELETKNGTPRQVQHLLSEREKKYLKRIARGPTAEYGGRSLDDKKTQDELCLNQSTKIKELQGRLTPNQEEFIDSIKAAKGVQAMYVKAMIGVPEDDIAAVLLLLKLQSEYDQLQKDIEKSTYASSVLESSPRSANSNGEKKSRISSLHFQHT